MNGPLLRLTARLWRGTAVFWPLGWGIYVFAVGASVSAISRSVDLEQIFRALPVGIGQAFGFSPPGGRYGGALYVLGAELFGSALILAAIFAMFVAPGLIAREADQGTLDTLLARPIARRSYAVTRIVFYVLVAIAVGGCGLAGSALAFGPVGGYPVPWDGLVAVSVLFTLGAIAFGTAGMAVAAWRLSTSAGTAAIAILLGVMFVLNLVAAGDRSLEALGAVSFFHYWKPIETLFDGRLAGDAVLVYASAALVGVLATILILERRDLA